MDLLIDIGNTNLKWAVHDSGSLGEMSTVRHHGGLPIDLQPPATTSTDPPPWELPPWPPVVPAEIIADPIPACSDCGRVLVVPGQPGRLAGLCFDCWSKENQKTIIDS